MESKEFPESMEGMVKFSELDTCALALGFDKNRSAAEQLRDVTGAEILELFEDLLLNVTKEKPSRMKFRPSEEMKIIYSQIAEVELKRLAEIGEAGFSCGRRHSLEQHKKSLEEVLSKLKPTVN